MAWLFFIDESGHDHKTMPYEVRGGFAIHVGRLWPFVQDMQRLEIDCFGRELHTIGREIKGASLVDRKRFRFAGQDDPIHDVTRQRLCISFLAKGRQGASPRREEFTAYGQACLRMARETVGLLRKHEAVVFASVIPRGIAKPRSHRFDRYLRKDVVFLLERYFANTSTGRHRTAWIVPTPFFVSSDMTSAIQAADLCIYCINWGFRLPDRGMNAERRNEIARMFGRDLFDLQFRGQGQRNGRVFDTYGIVYVPDPYEARAIP